MSDRGGQAVFFQQLCGFGGSTFGDQSVCIAQVRVTNQQRIGIGRVEVGQRREAFGLASSLQVAGSQVVGDVVSQVASQGLGAVQRIDCFGIVMVEEVGVAHDEPGQRSGILFGMGAGVGFHSRIASRSAILNQLLRHGA